MWTDLKPFIKWTGTKTALAKHILPHTHGKGPLVVPFLGAGGFTVKFIQHYGDRQPLRLSDCNIDLIETYEVVRNDPDELIKRLEDLTEYHSESFFYETRTLYNRLRLLTLRSYENKIQRAALFIYIQNAGFNSLHQVNRSGDLNVPIGRRHDGSLHQPQRICPKRAIRAWARLLKNDRTILVQQDFRHALLAAKPGSEIYCDPPYRYTDGYVRTTDTWNETCDRRLENFLTFLVTKPKSKIRALVSQPDTPFARRIWERHERFSLSRSGRMSCKTATRSRAPELLYRVRAKRSR